MKKIIENSSEIAVNGFYRYPVANQDGKHIYKQTHFTIRRFARYLKGNVWQYHGFKNVHEWLAFEVENFLEYGFFNSESLEWFNDFFSCDYFVEIEQGIKKYGNENYPETNWIELKTN